jgi:hypothetical protein
VSATVAETVTYAEDSLSPLTVSKPASFASGQMLVLAMIQHNNPSAQSDLTGPTGWTFQGAFDGTIIDGKVWSYVFTGSDPATWDFPYKSTADVCAFLFRITGADVATPTVVVSTTPTSSVTSPMDSPSVTPTGVDDLLLALISDICNGTILAATVPAGMTDLGLAEVSGHFMSSRAAYQQLASGSATGVRTWTSVSPTGIAGGTWTIAVKSAASGGGTTVESGRGAGALRAAGTAVKVATVVSSCTGAVRAAGSAVRVAQPAATARGALKAAGAGVRVAVLSGAGRGALRASGQPGHVAALNGSFLGGVRAAGAAAKRAVTAGAALGGLRAAGTVGQPAAANVPGRAVTSNTPAGRAGTVTSAATGASSSTPAGRILGGPS